ncbi:MAG: hypothetical protein EOO07_16645 [Chitinophagaceae bacterium]|nr:MAG: hypothetical protein EOO07_16645 [Chitinophagaceae bacterium]
MTALATAYKCPIHKFNLGFSTVLLSAIAMGCVNFFLGIAGNPTDLSGIQGSIIIAAFSLPTFIIPSIAGAFLGRYMAEPSS